MGVPSVVDVHVNVADAASCGRALSTPMHAVKQTAFVWYRAKPASDSNVLQARKSKIDLNKHTVLESVHPSPLSAQRGFFGCKHFSSCNAALRERGLGEIDWQVPP